MTWSGSCHTGLDTTTLLLPDLALRSGKHATRSAENEHTCSRTLAMSSFDGCCAFGLVRIALMSSSE